MQREHEEAMRADFTARIELGNQRLAPGVTEADFDRIEARTGEIDRRWETGPYAEQWEFLNDAHHDWSHSPAVMERMRADIAHNQQAGGGVGFSEVQLRSLEQARILTQPQRTRQAERAQRPARER